MKANGVEVIGRLSNGAPAEADVSRPKAEQEAIDQHQQMTDLIDTLEKAGKLAWAEEERKASAKLPKLVASRQLRGQADVINYCAELEE